MSSSNKKEPVRAPGLFSQSRMLPSPQQQRRQDRVSARLENMIVRLGDVLNQTEQRSPAQLVAVAESLKQMLEQNDVTTAQRRRLIPLYGRAVAALLRSQGIFRDSLHLSSITLPPHTPYNSNASEDSNTFDNEEPSSFFRLSVSE